LIVNKIAMIISCIK